MRPSAWAKRAEDLTQSVYALYLAARHPCTPWIAKAIAALVVAYAATPFDLIPDFIPFLGHLDDIVLVPLGLWVASRWIPREVWQECRAKASEVPIKISTNPYAAVGLLMLWLAVLVGLGLWIFHAVK